MKTTLSRGLSVTLLVLLLSSCSLQKDPEQPSVSVNSNWLNANVDYSKLLLNASFNTWGPGQNMNQNADLNINLNSNASLPVAPTSTPTASPSPSPSSELTRTISIIPPEFPADTNLMVPHEVAFDCGVPRVFEKRKFYNRFILQLENLLRYSPPEVAELVGDKDVAIAKKVQLEAESRDNLFVACFAKDESLIIGLVTGDADRSFGTKLVRYLPYRDLMEIAVRSDQIHSVAWPLVPTSFGPRHGRVITLKGSGKEGTTTISGEFGYDYIANFLELTSCAAASCRLLVRPLPTPLSKE